MLSERVTNSKTPEPHRRKQDRQAITENNEDIVNVECRLEQSMKACGGGVDVGETESLEYHEVQTYGDVPFSQYERGNDVFEKKSTAVMFDESIQDCHLYTTRSPMRPYSATASTAPSPPFVHSPRSTEDENINSADNVLTRPGVPSSYSSQGGGHTTPIEQLVFSQRMAQDILEMKETLYVTPPFPSVNTESPTPFTDLILSHGLRIALRIAVDNYLPDLAKSMDLVILRKNRRTFEASSNWIDKIGGEVAASGGGPANPASTRFDSSVSNSSPQTNRQPTAAPDKFPPPGIFSVNSTVERRSEKNVDSMRYLMAPQLDLEHVVQWDHEDQPTNDYDQVGLSLLGNWTCAVRDRVRSFPPKFASPKENEQPSRNSEDFETDIKNPESRLSPDAASFRPFETTNQSYMRSESHRDDKVTDVPSAKQEEISLLGTNQPSVHEIHQSHWPRPSDLRDSNEQFSFERMWGLDNGESNQRHVPRFFDEPAHSNMDTVGGHHRGRYMESYSLGYLDGSIGQRYGEDGSSLMKGSNVGSADNNELPNRRYNNDQDRMVYVSWIPKKARAFTTTDKRKQELDLKRRLREELNLLGLNKVLLFPPKGVHCKLIFDHRTSAGTFLEQYGGDNCSDPTEKWKRDLCRIYDIDMLDRFDKTVVKIEWSQK